MTTVKIVFTIHAQEKIKSKEAKLLGITKQKIKNILINPDVTDKSVFPHKNIGILNKTLSLVVIWKLEDDIMKVVTFYPAEKGRYERKLYSKRI